MGFLFNSLLFVDLVGNIQTRMRERVLASGVAIETNPTSNYLIGPYHKYKDLPLINFNRYKLDESYKTNIPVCVNTDDQGIFGTSLYNEYCILYKILTSKEDELDETCNYSTERVSEYLDYLRELSNIYQFK